jgi:hypothetical protein
MHFTCSFFGLELLIQTEFENIISLFQLSWE